MDCYCYCFNIVIGYACSKGFRHVSLTVHFESIHTYTDAQKHWRPKCQHIDSVTEGRHT